MSKTTISRRAVIRFLLVALVLIIPLAWTLWTAYAATRTWDGGAGTGNTNWMTATNWVGNIAPVANDDLTFPSSPGGIANNNFAAGTSFGKLTMNGGYQLTGNSAIFTGGIEATAGLINLSSLRVNFIDNPTVGNSVAISSDINNGGSNLGFDGDGNILVNGNLNNVGALLINSSQTGIVTLTGSRDSGQTFHAGNTLRLQGDQRNSSIAIGAGAVLEGGGHTGSIANSSDATILPGGGTPATNVLTAHGDITLNSNAILKIARQGSSGPFGQLVVVNGTVNLGNSNLDFSYGSIPPAEGETITLIDNDGSDAVVGAFNGLPEGSVYNPNGGSFVLYISYRGGSGNDVVLHRGTTGTWDGGGADSNWMTAANWVGDIAPGPGDALVFPAGAARLSNNNNFPAGTVFSRIILSGSNYSLGGNNLTLSGGLDDAATSGSSTSITFQIRLLGNQPFTVVASSRILLLRGGIDTNDSHLNCAGSGTIFFTDNPITGDGGIRQTGSGSTFLMAINTYTGVTHVLDGRLVVDRDQPSAVNVSGGIVEGGGKTGAITASGGKVRPGGITGSVFTTDGNVVFSSSTTFEVSAPFPTTAFSRLMVNGTVTLGGATLSSLPNSPVPAGDQFVIINNDGSTDPVNGIFGGLPEGSTVNMGDVQWRVSYVGGDGNDVALTSTSSTVQFAANYFVGEASAHVPVQVTRAGDISGSASVRITTSDEAATQNCNVVNGEASARCDYVTRIATVQFAPGENSKTIPVFIINDSYLEGPETFHVGLINPVGAALGQLQVANVTINDDEIATGPNPVDTAGFFVRQHYLDFFTREPDAPGFAFWTDQINSCGADQACISLKRINVSAAFYLAIEFEKTGYLVERTYKAAYGDAIGTSTFGGNHTLPVPIVRFEEFLPDTQQIGAGVVVGQPNWEFVLETNKNIFVAGFVERSRFTTAFPVPMSAAQFVDTLNLNAGNPLSQLERDELVSDLAAGAKTRAQVLRAVAEDSDLNNFEKNRAFVLMQYFGYLRRNPNDPQDTDYTGYDFWLTKLSEFNGNFVNAEMVKAFITSGEYRQRFGP